MWHRHSLCVLYKFYKSYRLPPVGLKIIEFSTGLVISYEISFTLRICDSAVRIHREKQRSAPDVAGLRSQSFKLGTLYFECVVQELEGKEPRRGCNEIGGIATSCQTIIKSLVHTSLEEFARAVCKLTHVYQTRSETTVTV